MEMFGRELSTLLTLRKTKIAFNSFLLFFLKLNECLNINTCKLLGLKLKKYEEFHPVEVVSGGSE